MGQDHGGLREHDVKVCLRRDRALSAGNRPTQVIYLSLRLIRLRKSLLAVSGGSAKVNAWLIVDDRISRAGLSMRTKYRLVIMMMVCCLENSNFSF